MGFDNKYPYTDFHELNLDWFLQEFNKLLNEWADLAADNAEFKQTMTQRFNTLDQTVQEFIQFVNNYFDNLDVQQEINNKLNDMVEDGTLSELLRPYFNAFTVEIDARMRNQDDRISVLEGRMDTFTHLTDGSTSGDAELQDIRVGANGVTYPTAGDAVRSQFEDLDEILEKYNSVQYLPDLTNGTNSRNGIDYTISNNIVSMEGTATTGGYIIRIIYNTTSKPAWVYSGNKVRIKITKTGRMNSVRLIFYRYESGNNHIIMDSGTREKDDYEFTFPEAVYDGFAAVYYINGGFSCDGSIKSEVFNAYSNEYLSDWAKTLQNELNDILPDEYYYPVITIKENGGDYSSIRTAFETEGPNKIYEIYEGTYNVENDFTSTEIANASYSSAGTGFVGVRVPDNVVVRGIGNKHNIIVNCTLDPNTYSYVVRSNIATLNLFGNCTIENITIKATYARTPIHDDFNANADKKHIIRNCILSNDVVERNTSHGYGLGLKSGEHVVMENCDIFPTMVCHSNTGFTNESGLDMINCTIYSTLQLQELNSTKCVYVNLINCKYGLLSCSTDNNNKYMKIRIPSYCDSPIVMHSNMDIDGYPFEKYQVKEAITTGQLVKIVRHNSNYGATDIYELSPTTDYYEAIGVALEDAEIGSTVKIIKINKYLHSSICDISSVSLGDKIGISDGKLVVDNSGTIGFVSLMTSSTSGIIKLY